MECGEGRERARHGLRAEADELREADAGAPFMSWIVLMTKNATMNKKKRARITNEKEETTKT